MATTLFLVAVGGAIGAMFRYLSVIAALRLFGAHLPWGTLFVNVAGSLVMGVLAAIILERLGPVRGHYFLMTGVLGGFTTFSAFSLDVLMLIEKGRVAAATAYIGGSVALSILALALGLWLGRSA